MQKIYIHFISSISQCRNIIESQFCFWKITLWPSKKDMFATWKCEWSVNWSYQKWKFVIKNLVAWIHSSLRALSSGMYRLLFYQKEASTWFRLETVGNAESFRFLNYCKHDFQIFRCVLESWDSSLKHHVKRFSLKHTLVKLYRNPEEEIVHTRWW